MNCKTRTAAAIRFQPTDRAPAGLFGTHPDYEQGLAEYIGVKTIEEMYRRLGVDVWHARTRLCFPQNNDWFHQKNGPPFADADSIDFIREFQFMRPCEMDCDSYINELDTHSEFFICGGINSAIFHRYMDLCGQENALCLLRQDPELAQAIIDKITDFYVEYLELVLKAGAGKIDMIENCNDFGTQRSMFISVDDFRTFFKKPLKRLYDTAKKRGVFYMQHSCGSVFPIISDYIEMGADVLNPIQVLADHMSVNEIAAAFGGKITLYGGIDTQWLLPTGTSEDVRAETSRVLNLFKDKGGYILSGSQGLMDDIPFENAKAMLMENLNR